MGHLDSQATMYIGCPNLGEERFYPQQNCFHNAIHVRIIKANNKSFENDCKGMSFMYIMKSSGSGPNTVLPWGTLDGFGDLMCW